jgi:hypothetical protein
MNVQGTSPQLDLEKAKAEAAERYLTPNGNVIGIGMGKKQINGASTDCLRVYVVKRQPEDLIAPSQVIRKDTTISGYPVDVIEVGRFGRNGAESLAGDGTTTRPGSPIRVKTEATNVNEGALGTLGAVVTDGQALYILGCNHVLAVNGRVSDDPKLAQVVSAEFVGVEPEIAHRDRFVRLKRNGGNSVDCAIARVKDRVNLPTSFPDGTIQLVSDSATAPRFGMPVTKFGAGTGLTRGAIVDIDADLYVDYSFGTYRFDHQIIIESVPPGGVFATNGDSGAIVVDSNGEACGMIFAGSGSFAVACPLLSVLAELGGLLNVTSKAPLRLVTENVTKVPPQAASYPKG